MKRMTPATAAILLLLLSANLNAQSGGGRTLRDHEILKERFKELDKEPGKVSAELGKSRDPFKSDKSMGDVYLKVERHSAAGASETLFVVDLSTIEAPSSEELNLMISGVLDPPSARCGAIPSVVIAQLNASTDYEVQADYTYDTGSCRITVPRGFVYDRASIPAIVWPIISPDSLGNVAPLLHDYLYRHGGRLPKDRVNPYKTFSREETDDLFLELMTKCQVSAWRRSAAHKAVRMFSEFAWKEPPTE